MRNWVYYCGMTLIQRSWLPLAFLSLFFLGGCTSTNRALCDRSAECDLIGNDDIDECTSDLDKAIDAGDLDVQQVKDCQRCAEDNSCGTDLLVDCAAICGDVSAVIIGSNIH